MSIVVAAIFAGLELTGVLTGWLSLGIDFLPLRSAAQALAHGSPVFGDPSFVYPPTAAVVLLPLALGEVTTAFIGWVLAGAAAMVLAAVLVARAAPVRWRTVVLGVALLGLLGSLIASRSLYLGNLSELLVPVAVGTLLCFHRGRWVLGCALLAASLLVKPLLAPLILVPLLHRRWSALARTMLPGGALLLLSMVLVPGGTDFPSVLRYCLGGTNLHGANALNNLSLRGWAEWHQVPHLIGVLASVVVLGVGAAVAGRRLRGGNRPDPVWLGNVVLLTTFLAGRISEVHFLLVVLATVLLQVVLRPMPRRVAVRFLPGLLLLALPASYLPLLLGRANDGQTWLVTAEVLLLGALLTVPVRDPVPAEDAVTVLVAT